MTLWAAELLTWRPPPTTSRTNVLEVGTDTTGAVVAAMEEEGDLVSLRLARGCRCQAAWMDQRVIGYGWLSTAPEWIGELGLEIRSAPGEAYIWNCVTLPAHRRRGIFASILVETVRAARAGGKTRVWIATRAGSGESAVAQSGFTPALGIETRAFLGLQLLTVRAVRGAPRGLVESARNALCVHRNRLVHRQLTRRH